MPNVNRVDQNRRVFVSSLECANGGGMYPAATVTATAFAAGSYDAATKAYTVTATGTDAYDGHTMALGDRILITSSTTGNGLYVCTVEGDTGVQPVYTRAPEMFVSSDFIDGAIIPIRLGTSNIGKVFTASVAAGFVLDTDTATFTASASTVSAGTVITALASAGSAVDFNDQAITGVPSVAGDTGVTLKRGATSIMDAGVTTSTDVTILANKNLTAATGTGAVDFSAASGTFKTSTGTNTLGGNVVISGSKTLTTGTGLTTISGPLAFGASAYVIADPGAGAAIPVTTSGYVPIVTAGAETNTLAVPTFRGQRLILCMDTRVGGDRVVTASQGINQAGNTVMTFGAARDVIELVGITVGGALRWQVVFNDGVGLS